MVSADVRKKIKELEVQTRRLLRGTLVGQSSSAIKGSGLDFDQIRVYQQGDDVRYIDWKSSARTGELMTRQYIQERSRTIILAVDVSVSAFFGSTDTHKYEVVAQIAGALALVADMAKDQVMLVLFAHEVVHVVPASKGLMHVRRILELLFTQACPSMADGEQTSLTTLCSFIARQRIKNGVLVLLSDFIAPDFSRSLRMVAQRYETIAIRVLDPKERIMPVAGYLPVIDPETGQEAMLYSNGSHGVLSNQLSTRVAAQKQLFRRCAIDLLDVQPAQDYVHDFVLFFKHRMLY